MKTYFFSKLSADKISKLCARSAVDFSQIFPIVDDIQKEILSRGDAAIRDFTEKFDGVRLEDFSVSVSEFLAAEKKVKSDLKKAISVAAKNIQKFHEKTAPKNSEKIETTAGVFCWRKFCAIEKVGIYIPGGSAPLFSTLLMLAIPAKIAGVKNVFCATPPQKNGKIAPEILVAAKIAGVKNIFKMGGAHAIFALANGTKKIPKVDKIFGPGNAFVTAAKMRISEKCAIDMPAGPSEVLVVADENSRADFVAADLLSQCEHGADSQSVAVVFSSKKADEILAEMAVQIKSLPRRKIVEKSLQNSFFVICENENDAIKFTNFYAPEHLILHLKSSENFSQKIQNAGSVFVGEFSPESAGDYASGTNHTLPTSGFARAFSGVSVESFGKWISFQKLSRAGLSNLAPTIEKMAIAEGLLAHKNAVSIRLKK